MQRGTCSWSVILAITLLAALTKPVEAASLRAQAAVHLVNAGDWGLEVVFESPQIAYIKDQSGEFTHLSLPGAQIYQAATGFNIPAFNVLVGIPPQGAVSFEVLEDESLSLPDDVRIMPEELLPHAKLPPTVVVGDPAWVRYQRIVRLSIYPVQVDASTGQAYWHKHLRLKLLFTEQSPNNITPINDTSPSGQVLAYSLINPAQAAQWQTQPTEILDRAAPLALDPLATRYRIEVNEDGLYRLEYSDLNQVVDNIDTLDPRNLHLYCQGEELSFIVEGEADGHFNPTDYLLFYGQKLRGDRLALRYASESSQWVTFDNGWHPQFNARMVEKYTTTNIYWLTVEIEPGLRMTTRSGTPGTAFFAQSYAEIVRAEEQRIWWTWHLTGEDTWLWDSIQLPSPGPVAKTFAVVLDHVYTGEQKLVSIRGEVTTSISVPQESPDHRILLNFNTIPLGNQTWDGANRKSFQQSIWNSQVLEGQNMLEMTVYLDAFPGQVRDTIYMDWYEVTYPRQFAARQDMLVFKAPETAALRYQVSEFTAADSWAMALDITNPARPVQLTGVVKAGGIITFESTSTASTRYLVASTTGLRTASITAYNPEDLLSIANQADYVIIAPALFLPSLEPLKTDLEARGMVVKIIDVQQLYNLFNDGIYHPIAIKNFLAYTFAHWTQPAPAYALLVGDGHWNFLGYNPTTYGDLGTIYLPPNLSWVDYTLGEVDSASLLAAVVGNDILPDLAIGRLPVNSVLELDTAVGKMLAYRQQAAGQAWQRHAVFIADNYSNQEGAGNFPQSLNALISSSVTPGFAVDRFYLDDYGCTSSADPDCIQLTNDLVGHLNTTGASLMVYQGHGWSNYWAGEQVFKASTIPSLTNGNQLPLVLSLTCMDGYWDAPPKVVGSLSPNTLSENLVRTADKGAIATFSPTGYSANFAHDILGAGFLQAIFLQGERDLGAAALAGKLAVYASGQNADLVHMYTIFGDPSLALHLGVPDHLFFLPLVRK